MPTSDTGATGSTPSSLIELITVLKSTAVRTSASESYQKLTDVAVVNKRLVAPIPPQSVTTFVVSDVTVPLSLSRKP